MEKKLFGGIDLAKFVASFLVVALHFPPLADLSGDLSVLLTNGVTRIAVPFFFCCSGFFLEEKMRQRDGRVIFRYLRRIFVLWLIWSVLAMPLTYIDVVRNLGDSGGWIRIHLRRSFTNGHMWYLVAMMVGTAIVWAARKRLSLRVCTALAGALFLVGLFGDSYSALRHFLPQPLDKLIGGYVRVFATTRDGVFFAPLFLCIGGLFAQSRDGLRIKQGGNILLFGLSLAAASAESWLLVSNGIALDCNLFLSLIPATVFAFNLAVHAKGPGARAAGMLRGCSVVVYCVHPLVGWVFFGSQGVGILGMYNSAVRFLCIAVASLGIALAVVALSRKRGLRFLRYLY